MLKAGSLEPLAPGMAFDTFYHRRAALHYGGVVVIRKLIKRIGLAVEQRDEASVASLSRMLEVTVNAIEIAFERDPPGEPNALPLGGGWGTFLEIEPKMLDRNFQVNVMGLLYLAREVAADMIKAGRGTILVTGNTSAIRGKANFAGFAPTKAAQRILSESIARELGPLGIHVAYVLIDVVIDVPRMRERLPEAPDAFFIKPTAIADELWHL